MMWGASTPAFTLLPMMTRASTLIIITVSLANCHVMFGVCLTFIPTDAFGNMKKVLFNFTEHKGRTLQSFQSVYLKGSAVELLFG
jgi:hypothetical protein